MSEVTPKAACRIDGCERPMLSLGMCSMHYQRTRIWGDPRPDVPPLASRLCPTPEEAFNERFAEAQRLGPAQCWIWPGTIEQGYGVIKRHRFRLYAHRLSYEKRHGSIPDGLFIDHICREPACFNPDHLRAVTTKQNNENRSTDSALARSGVRGVHYHRSTGKWLARVKHNSVRYEAGSYSTIEEAKEAVTRLRLSLHTHNTQDRVTP